MALFLSTLSLRRATGQGPLHAGNLQHFYPRSPCGERPHPADVACGYWNISIHALLAESDFDNLQVPASISKISIHALLAESDFRQTSKAISSPIFLSTLSLRRATLCHNQGFDLSEHFYPRSPCGERLVAHLLHAGVGWISIHALLAESDDASKDVIKTISNFYPRSPCGERRPGTHQHDVVRLISIHALLAESDCIIDIINNIIDDFYPRSPCGERLHQ